MSDYRYLFGPVPSRRLGVSLGVSPIPERTCNYSCVYCQLGRTAHMTNHRQAFFPLEDILTEFDAYQRESIPFDVVTIVGEGEPTLYSRLGDLIRGLKARTDKPVAVITNGALFYDEQTRQDLMEADLVLPSLDAASMAQFQVIDRPIGSLDYNQMLEGLRQFAQDYAGQLWVEVMLVRGMNDSPADLDRLADVLSTIRHDRVYVNTPVRPPAEGFVQTPDPEAVTLAVERLGAISIDMLTSGTFFSEIEDPYAALLSIIRRHPMNQFEVISFLSSRSIEDSQSILQRLDEDPALTSIPYKGITTYRIR